MPLGQSGGPLSRHTINKIADIGTGGGGTITSILGTANQITASTSGGVVTLTTPQAIATTSEVEFQKLTVTLTNTSTNTRPDLLVLRHLLSSGAPTENQFGGTISCVGEDAVGTNSEIARIQFVLADDTAGAVGGSLRFAVAISGSLTVTLGLTDTSITVNPFANDIDFAITSDNNNTLFSTDAGTEQAGFGAVSGAAQLNVSLPSLTATLNQDAFAVLIQPALTEAASGTHNLLGGLKINTFTITNGGAATTNAASLVIAGAPAGATNNYAVLVQSGTTRLDALLDLSNISAGSPNIKITATSDSPTVTWGAAAGNEASTTPAGYLELDVGGAARYIPFWA